MRRYLSTPKGLRYWDSVSEATNNPLEYKKEKEMGMNPDTGLMEALNNKGAHKAFEEMFEKRHLDCDVAQNVADSHPELERQRSRGECPVFSEGEILYLKGGAFRVGRIKSRGMMLRPVKDADLPFVEAKNSGSS